MLFHVKKKSGSFPQKKVLPHRAGQNLGLCPWSYRTRERVWSLLGSSKQSSQIVQGLLDSSQKGSACARLSLRYRCCSCCEIIKAFGTCLTRCGRIALQALSLPDSEDPHYFESASVLCRRHVVASTEAMNSTMPISTHTQSCRLPRVLSLPASWALSFSGLAWSRNPVGSGCQLGRNLVNCLGPSVVLGRALEASCMSRKTFALGVGEASFVGSLPGSRC